MFNKFSSSLALDENLDEMYSFRDKCRVIDDIKQSYEVIKR